MKKKIAIFIILIVLLAAYMKEDIIGIVLNSNIDNTVHGWEVKKNTNHIQPDIPQAARKMLAKYNGIYVGSADKKVIYLTIDLGYESGNTMAILDTLKNNNVKATFFIIESYLKKNEAIVDRIVNEGHSLQNHTANYKHLEKLDDTKVKKEIMDMHSIIKQKYSIEMKYLRLPYEDWSERILKIANDTGYKTVFWSIACVDWVEDRDAGYIYNSVMNNHHNGAVILLHGVSKSSPQAINMIIRDLKKNGYEFRTLDM